MSDVPFKTLNLEPVKCNPTDDEISVIITFPNILLPVSIDIDRAEAVVTDIILLVEKFNVVVNDDDRVKEVEPTLVRPFVVMSPLALMIDAVIGVVVDEP